MRNPSPPCRVSVSCPRIIISTVPATMKPTSSPGWMCQPDATPAGISVSTCTISRPGIEDPLHWSWVRLSLPASSSTGRCRLVVGGVGLDDMMLTSGSGWAFDAGLATRAVRHLQDGHFQDGVGEGVRSFLGRLWAASCTEPRVGGSPAALAEGEGVGLDARIQEGDLKGALADRAWLANELVEPWLGDRAVALVVDIRPVGASRGQPVDTHMELHGRLLSCRSHDQVQVAGVEAVEDPPTGLVQRHGPPLHRPGTGKGPMVEPQPCGGGIVVPRIQDGATG